LTIEFPADAHNPGERIRLFDLGKVDGLEEGKKLSRKNCEFWR